MFCYLFVDSANALAGTMNTIRLPSESGLYLECCCSITLPQKHEILLPLKEVGASSLLDDSNNVDRPSILGMVETQCIHGYCGCSNRFEFSPEVKTICAW